MLRTDCRRKLEKGKYGFVIFLCAGIVFFIDFLLNVIRSGTAQDMDLLTWVYYIPSAIGHACLLGLIIFLVGFVPFALLFRSHKVATATFLILLIITQILLILNTYVYSFYKFHLNGFVFSLVLEGGSEVFEIGTAVYIKFILIALFTAVLPFIVAQWISRSIHTQFTRKRIVWISLGIFFCVVYSHIGHATAAAVKHSGIRKSALAMPYFFPLTMNSLLFDLGLAKRDYIDNLTYNVYSSDIQYPVAPLVTDDTNVEGYNIIYILLDSWNPSSFDEETVPNMYAFSKNAHVFNNHYSSSFATQGGVFGLFFGLPFTYEKEFSISKISPVIIDRFIDLDYNIQTFPSATFKAPPFHEMIYRRVPGIMTSSEGNDSFERDNYITSKFKEYIEEYDSEKPFFTFLFYDLLHAINIPKEHLKFQPSWETPDYLSLNNNIDPTPFFNLYRNCAYHIDTLVGEVFAVLEEKGYLENSVIIITGDHGQEFNENRRNYWGHGGNFTKWQVQVPFILRYPGMEEEGKVFEHMTTHYDVTPTVMNLFLGVKNAASDYTTGHNLYNESSRYPHLVGDHVNYGFLYEDLIVTTNHYGSIDITDSQLNPLKRGALNANNLQKALAVKNKFYK